MSFIRKYWIAGLVILLVAIHAVIIGYIRSEATRLKTVASSEIPVGLFYKQSGDREWLTQLRVHVQVPPERRLAARATIEHNRWLIHESIEETVRRLDESLLLDPSLVAVKAAIKQAIDEALQEELVNRVVINDRVDLETREFHVRPTRDLVAPGEEDLAANSTTLTSVRPVRPALSTQNATANGEATDPADEHGDGHGDEEGDAAEAGHSTHGTSESAAHKPSAHGAKKAASHAPAKKSGHGH
jgi:hypothetical protein